MNSSGGNGGGFYIEIGTLKLLNDSTLAGNSATGLGDGGYVAPGAFFFNDGTNVDPDFVYWA